MAASNVLYDMDADRLSKRSKELIKQKVLYSNVDREKLSSREVGSDFEGTMREFQLTFEWVWETPEEKRLHEKAISDLGTKARFTGWVHIKDELLDKDTYPGQQQKILIEKGLIKLVKED